MKVLDLSQHRFHERMWHEEFIDFNNYVSGDQLTLVATDSGTFALSDAANGVGLLHPSDGTVADNDESYLKTTKELFLFADDKPLVVECRISFAEAATDDANLAFGLMDAVAANSIVDDGAGPKASYSGAVFFKEDGQTLWTTESSIAGTQNTVQLTAANSLDKNAWTAGNASYQTLRIESRPLNATEHDVAFYIDQGNGLRLVSKHTRRVYTNATEMNLFIGLKNGGATEDTLLIDYLWWAQKR